MAYTVVAGNFVAPLGAVVPPQAVDPPSVSCVRRAASQLKGTESEPFYELLTIFSGLIKPTLTPCSPLNYLRSLSSGWPRLRTQR